MEPNSHPNDLGMPRLSCHQAVRAHVDDHVGCGRWGEIAQASSSGLQRATHDHFCVTNGAVRGRARADGSPSYHSYFCDSWRMSRAEVDVGVVPQ